MMRRTGLFSLSPVPNRAGLFRGTRLSVLAPLICFQPHSDLAHEHGTTRCMSTPTVLENKNPLLKALSDLKVY
jgi:hypothetical protein